MILFIYSEVCFSSKDSSMNCNLRVPEYHSAICTFTCKGLIFFFHSEEDNDFQKSDLSTSMHVVGGLHSLTQLELHCTSGL